MRGTEPVLLEWLAEVNHQMQQGRPFSRSPSLRQIITAF